MKRIPIWNPKIKNILDSLQRKPLKKIRWLCWDIDVFEDNISLENDKGYLNQRIEELEYKVVLLNGAPKQLEFKF